MPTYLTKVTVTSGKRKLAPGRHEFSKEIGDKLVARGFAAEVVEAPKAAAPAEPKAPKAPVAAAPNGKAKAAEPKAPEAKGDNA